MGKTGGSAFIAVSAVAFGSMALCAHTLYGEGMDTYSVLGLRFLTAAILLGALLVLRRTRLPAGRALALCGAMGVSFAVMAWAYFAALHFIASSTVALILYAYPVLVAVSAAALRIDTLGRAEALALVAVLGGLVLLLSGRVDLEWHGVALSCFAALLYATYILLGTALKESSDPYASSFVIVLVAGVLLQAMALIQGQTWPHSNQGWGALLFLAVAGTALAICSFIVGLKATGPTLAAVLSTLEPIVTVSLGVLFLHETLAPRAWCGGVLVIGAALALAIKKSRQARRAPASTAAVAGLPCLTLE